MGHDSKLELRFWGVRGSIPTPVPQNLGYGGNTACLEVRYGGEPALMFDSGSGARQLCDRLMKKTGDDPLNVDIFLTHFHWDHIQGIPFMQALYHPSSQITFYSTQTAERLEQILRGQMTDPYFPLEFSGVRANLEHRQISDTGMVFGSVTVKPFPLRHPDGASGYRIEAPEGCIVYASDHEHGDPRYDEGIIENAQRADILIYDAQFTPQEYKKHEGWGHSTWLAGARIARKAGVKQLVLFHHDPSHDDRQIAEIESAAQVEFENTIAAKEGWSSLECEPAKANVSSERQTASQTPQSDTHRESC